MHLGFAMGTWPSYIHFDFLVLDHLQSGMPKRLDLTLLDFIPPAISLVWPKPGPELRMKGNGCLIYLGCFAWLDLTRSCFHDILSSLSSAFTSISTRSPRDLHAISARCIKMFFILFLWRGRNLWFWKHFTPPEALLREQQAAARATGLSCDDSHIVYM